jgi:hypothetical protein
MSSEVETSLALNNKRFLDFARNDKYLVAKIAAPQLLRVPQSPILPLWN